MPAGPLRALTDNWLIEAAFRQLIEGSVRTHPVYGSLTTPEERREQVLSLLHFLDLLVLYDEILFEPTWSRAWRRVPLASAVEGILVPIETSEPTSDSSSFDSRYTGESPAQNRKDNKYLVQQRALHYAGLSSSLWAAYWPAPRRADFLRSTTFDSQHPFFAIALNEFLAYELEKAVREALAPL